MNVKRYIGENMTQAVDQIRSELGLDAYILNSRKVRRKGIAGLFRSPLVEVVAAYDNTNTPPPPGPADMTPSAFRALAFPDAVTGIRHELPQEDVDREKIEELENKLDTLTGTLNNLVSKMQISRGEFQKNYPPEIEGFIFSLLENEVHEEFAHKVGREVTEILERQGEDARDVFEQILKQYLGDPAPIKLKRYKRTVVLFVGPTGVGKTTTLAKLAAIYTLNHHAKVGIITTDTYRIAAVEQLRTYAEILEVPLTVAYAAEDIPDALRGFEDRDIVFIDTTGKSPSDAMLETEISELLRYSDADEVHLVMSATTSFAGSLHLVNTYRFLRDFKLLFTKLDETPTWGMLLNLRFITDRPVSYMASGQNVPDDIEVVNTRKIINHLMGSKAE